MRHQTNRSSSSPSSSSSSSLAPLSSAGMLTSPMTVGGSGGGGSTVESAQLHHPTRLSGVEAQSLLTSLMAARLALEERIHSLDMHIYTQETVFLTEAAEVGNVFGEEDFQQGPSSSSSDANESTAGATTTMMTSTASKRVIPMTERLFSQTSVTGLATAEVLEARRKILTGSRKV